MGDTLVLRPATIADAPVLAATIAAAFEQYRGKLVPESGPFAKPRTASPPNCARTQAPSSRSETASSWAAS
jgi:hypothetical protein